VPERLTAQPPNELFCFATIICVAELVVLNHADTLKVVLEKFVFEVMPVLT
jgi:hypothetical protein